MIITYQGLAIWSFICLNFLLHLAKCYDEDNGENNIYQIQTGSQCFHVKGVPTLKLSCASNDLINVHQSFYGAPPLNTTCLYDSQDDHCIQLMDMQQNCMGRYTCSVYVSNPFLMNCRTYANYMQVNYTCIPKHRIHDVCRSLTVTTTQGYLRSPYYPDSNYTQNLHCGCRLKTNDDGILLQILDFAVNHTQMGVCESDYLKISGWGRKCGNVGPPRLPEKLEVDRREMTLEFHSDDRFQSRGFWMEYTGSEGGKVTMTCGAIQHLPPSDQDDNFNDLDLESDEKNDFVQPWDHNNNVLIDDTDAYPTIHNKDTMDNMVHSIQDEKEEEEFFDTYEFSETQSTFAYNVDAVQIGTGVVVGVLILIAVIIIIVLVFRR